MRDAGNLPTPREPPPRFASWWVWCPIWRLLWRHLRQRSRRSRPPWIAATHRVTSLLSPYAASSTGYLLSCSYMLVCEMMYKSIFCVAAKYGKGRTNLTKPLQMYIKFLNYVPKKIIFKKNLIRNYLCIRLNIKILYECFRYNCNNRNLYLTLPENFRENIKLNWSLSLNNLIIIDESDFEHKPNKE